MGKTRTIFLLICGGFSLSACGVYMHNPALKASTAEVKASFEAIGAPALLAEQRQHLLAAGKDEDQAVAGYATALRNETVLTLLRPGGTVRNPPPADRRLLGLINRDLEQVYGRSELTRDERYQLEMAREAIENSRQNLATSTGLVTSARNNFVAAAGNNDRRPTACAKVPPLPPRSTGAPPEFPPGATAADRAYAGLQWECGVWREASDFTALPNARGQIGAIREQLAALKKSRDEDAKVAEELKQEIKQASKASQRTPAEGSDGLAGRLDPLIEKLDRAPALARQAGLEEIASTLENRVIDELRGTATDVTEDEGVVAALALAGSARDTVGAFRRRPSVDKAGALLIGLATVRHKLNMAEADVAVQQGQMDNLRRQLSAAVARGAHLARAKGILETRKIPPISGFADLRTIQDNATRSAASEALTAYVAAWDEGEIPFQVLRFRAVQARRLAAIERAQLAEQDYRAVVKPAIDTMAEYGAGGLTEDAILTVLGHLGIAGSILTK